MAIRILALALICATLTACGGSAGDASESRPDVPPYQPAVNKTTQPVDCAASNVCF
jgi:hypothetical protein